MMDLKGTQECWSWRFRNEMWHKKIGKTIQDFITNNASKVEFLSTELFWRFKR